MSILLGIWDLGLRIFVFQRRTEFLPDIIDSLKDGEVGEDDKNPKNGLHPLEKGSYREENNSFRPFHKPDVAWNLQRFCLGSNVGDKNRTHTDKRSKDDETRISFF